MSPEPKKSSGVQPGRFDPAVLFTHRIKLGCGECALEQNDTIVGAMLGCAVGDAIGLPYEGLSRQRGIRLLGEPTRHRFVARRGMVSDDTEHICMVAQALCAAPTNPDAFARQLGRRLRWWLLGIPAGIGYATLRATLKLWLGFPPSRSGVFSAGNGPAMRSPLLGVAIDDFAALRAFVRASTQITHTDPKAYHGAFAVEVAAWCAKRGLTTPDAYFARYQIAKGTDASEEFDALLAQVGDSLASGDSTEFFARKLGCGRGVSGYMYRTVPVVLHGWLRTPSDYLQAVTTMIRCGGDTDTTAAIVGALVGAGVGRAGIPEEWQNRIWEWPHSVAWMERLAEAVNRAVKTRMPVQSPPVFSGVGLLRNAVFLTVLMGHVVRRLLPPY